MSVNEPTPPRIALRFDVDTYQCMHRGVPRLLELAEEQRIPLTFFINMGRAVSYPVLLRKAFARRNTQSRSASSARLSPVHKLGFPGTLSTLLANPRVGLSSRLLPEIQSRGHEIGLHGGRNHAAWQNHAHQWTKERLQQELDWGLRALEKAGITSPRSFASPGWNSPPALPAILSQKNFAILADHHSNHSNGYGFHHRNYPVHAVNTNLAGEPGGVGYLESCEARQLNFSAMAAEVEPMFERFTDIVMYDHPAYAGGAGFARLQALIRAGKNHQARFMTIEQMVDESGPKPAIA